MLQIGLPILFALFVWWASTGLIIFLDNLPPHTFKYSMVAGTVVCIIALAGITWSLDQPGDLGAYVAFAAGLLIWAWLEMGFYLGYVAGPRKVRCVAGCSGWQHFGHAVQASLYHELAILALAGVVVTLSWGAVNQVGQWTFVVLWWMHQSARLNVFLGVRNIDEEFLPPHLDHLRGFCRRRSMNPLFPISIVASTAIAAWLVWRAWIASPADTAGAVFLATMMALAILEHWFLMLPLPSARLWRWSLRSRAAGQVASGEAAG